MSHNAHALRSRSIPSSSPHLWSRLAAWLDPERRVVVALVALSLVLGVTYALITPLMVGPDEDVQYEYVQSLWDSGGAHVTGRASYHEPAYYWLDAPAYVLTRSQPKEIQVVAMRLVSVFMLLCEVVLAYLSAKLLSPNNRFVYLATPAIFALLPGRVWIGAVINDDNLASLSGTLVLYLFLRYLLRSRDRRILVALLASMLLALLAKATAWPVVVVIGGTLAAMGAVRVWRRGRPLDRGVVVAVLAVAGALLLIVAVVVAVGAQKANASSPVAVASRQGATGLLFALEARMPTRLSSLLQYDWSRFRHIPPWQPEPFIHQFKTFWIPLWSDDYSAPNSAYEPALLLSLVAVVGLVLSGLVALLHIRNRGISRLRLVILVALSLAAVSVWSASLLQQLLLVAGTPSFNQPRASWPPTHARYLFPALLPIAYLMAVGVGRFVPAGARQVGLMVFLCLLMYLDGLALWSVLSHGYWWAS